jgi:hypothetical protein
LPDDSGTSPFATTGCAGAAAAASCPTKSISTGAGPPLRYSSQNAGLGASRGTAPSPAGTTIGAGSANERGTTARGASGGPASDSVTGWFRRWPCHDMWLERERSEGNILPHNGHGQSCSISITHGSGGSGGGGPRVFQFQAIGEKGFSRGLEAVARRIGREK